MNLNKIVIPPNIETLFNTSYDILFNVSYDMLKKEPEFKNLQIHEYMNILFDQLKTRANFSFEVESERDDLDCNNSISLTFNDSEPEPTKKTVEIIEPHEEILEPLDKPIKSEKKKSVKKEKKKSVKKEKKSSGDEAKKKSGRPKMGKTIWRDIIIKSSDEWREANSFIQNFIDDFDDIDCNDQFEAFTTEQINLLKQYDGFNIISKIYRMLESEDYVEYLKGIYKKNESVLQNLNGVEINCFKPINLILDKEIKTSENCKEIEALVKINEPSELSLIK